MHGSGEHTYMYINSVSASTACCVTKSRNDEKKG